MKYNVVYYTFDNSCIIKKEFIVEAMEELRKIAREYAGSLVAKGVNIIGWDYIKL